jgi:hypothetical protein
MTRRQVEEGEERMRKDKEREERMKRKSVRVRESAEVKCCQCEWV